MFVFDGGGENFEIPATPGRKKMADRFDHPLLVRYTLRYLEAMSVSEEWCCVGCY